MAVSDTEKNALLKAGEQVRNIASGLSGNRAHELERLAGIVEDVANGTDVSGTPLTLAERASGDAAVQNAAAHKPDPQFQPAQFSAAPQPAPAPVPQPGTPTA